MVPIRQAHVTVCCRVPSQRVHVTVSLKGFGSRSDGIGRCVFRSQSRFSSSVSRFIYMNPTYCCLYIHDIAHHSSCLIDVLYLSCLCHLRTMTSLCVRSKDKLSQHVASVRQCASVPTFKIVVAASIAALRTATLLSIVQRDDEVGSLHAHLHASHAHFEFHALIEDHALNAFSDRHSPRKHEVVCTYCASP